MRTTWKPLRNETKLTYLLAFTFLFLFSTIAITEVSGDTKETNIATGTGFFLGSSNYVVTNYHVIHGAKKIQVKLVNGEILVAEVALKSPDKDIAILKLSGTPSVKRMIIRLSNFSEIRTGDKVFTYGFPIADILGDVSSIYSEGVINSLKGMRNKQDEFQMSIPIQPGNSGGPVFNEQGKLVGITSSTLSPLGAMEVLGIVPQNVNFGIKSSVLASLLSEIPEILKSDMGIVPVPSEPFTLRDFKEDIKKNIVFVTGLIEKEVGNFQVAEQAKEKGDYKTEFEQWKILAKQGFAEAQNNLGIMYQKGHGVPQDYTEAVKWYRLSAEQGHAPAQSNLGVMYELGQGVPQDYKEALRLFRLAAEQGVAEAQHNLGFIYHFGKGVPQDYKEAIKWFRLAAEQGHAVGQFDLGVVYERGRGVPQDYKEAIKWYRLSAEQGHAEAQYNYGNMFDNGLGVPQDYKEAAKWFLLAAEQGYAEGQHSLGSQYYFGEGVPQDYKEAAKWFLLAAEQGDAEGQGKLGTVYFKGQGVRQDYVLAYMWLNISASNGFKLAPKIRNMVQNRMTPSQIEEAQRLARNWKPKK